MIDANATVTSLDGDYAIVQMEETTGCGRCYEEGGCGGNNLGKMLCNSPGTFRVLNSGNASVGDRVTITIDEGVIRDSVILAYVLPLLSLFIGAFAGLSFAGEAGAIGGSIVGLIAAWVALRRIQRRKIASRHFQPRIKY